MSTNDPPEIESDHPALDTYWPERINEDAIFYREYATPGTWFYDRNENKYYQNVLPGTEGGEVRLEAATTVATADRIGTPTAHRQPETALHYVSTVSDLAGALCADELVHIPQETPIVAEGTVALATASGVQHVPRDAAPWPDEDLISAEYPLDDLPAQALYQIESQNDVPESSGNVLRNDEDDSVKVRYLPTTETSRWTYEVDAYRRWIEHHLPPGSEVLNLCCGRSRLHHDGTVVRVDVDEEIDSDITCDVAEIADHLDEPRERFDVVSLDPPWSAYQSNLRYQGDHVWEKSPSDSKTYGSEDRTPLETTIDLSDLPFEVPADGKKQLGHAKLMKHNIDYVLRPGGKVIQLSQHGSLMPADWEYSREERVCFDPIGEARVVVGAVDRKTQATLSDF
jgi:hypothetical protein